VAVLDVDDQVPAAAGVEAERKLLVAFAEAVFELVAVAPLFDRRDDLLGLEPLETADPPQRVLDLFLLVGKLPLVGEALQGRSRTGLAAVDAGVREAVLRGADQLDGPRLGEALLRFRDLGADPVPRQGPGDEDDEAVGAGDPPPAEGERVDLQLELLSPLYGRALRACLASRSSSFSSVSRCLRPFLTSSLSSFSASERVIRPRLTASSTTSWMRSRLSVTLCSRLSRNCATLLSRPLVALLEAFFAADALRFGALLEVPFFALFFERDFEAGVLFLVAFFDAAFLAFVALPLAFDFVELAALADFVVFDFAAAFLALVLLPGALPVAFFSAI
jgi:hypothetical protein